MGKSVFVVSEFAKDCKRIDPRNLGEHIVAVFTSKAAALGTLSQFVSGFVESVGYESSSWVREWVGETTGGGSQDRVVIQEFLISKRSYLDGRGFTRFGKRPRLGRG